MKDYVDIYDNARTPHVTSQRRMPRNKIPLFKEQQRLVAEFTRGKYLKHLPLRRKLQVAKLLRNSNMLDYKIRSMTQLGDIKRRNI